MCFKFLRLIWLKRKISLSSRLKSRSSNPAPPNQGCQEHLWISHLLLAGSTRQFRSVAAAGAALQAALRAAPWALPRSHVRPVPRAASETGHPKGCGRADATSSHGDEKIGQTLAVYVRFFRLSANKFWNTSEQQSVYIYNYIYNRYR